MTIEVDNFGVLLIIFLLMVLANITANFVQTFLFILFKADKYEDVLAKKIAREVNQSQ